MQAQDECHFSHSNRVTLKCFSLSFSCWKPADSSGANESKLKRSNADAHNSKEESKVGVNHPCKDGSGGIPSAQRQLRSNARQTLQPSSPNEKAMAFQRACAFESENPFFTVVMQPSCVTKEYTLQVFQDISKRVGVKSFLGSWKGDLGTLSTERKCNVQPTADFHHTSWI